MIVLMLNVVPVKVKGGVSEGVRGSFGRGDVCSVISGFGDVVEVRGRMWGSHPPRFVPCVCIYAAGCWCLK